MFDAREYWLRRFERDLADFQSLHRFPLTLDEAADQRGQQTHTSQLIERLRQ